MVASFTKEDIYNLIKDIPDPEVPVITIEDLGVLRSVEVDHETVHVIITPTYTGCPAMDMISVQIKAILQDQGIENVRIETVLSPPWTTDWLSEEAKTKLKEYGISPPDPKRGLPQEGITCPLCDSANTELLSAFGSTACKALYRCKECLEPFDYFKCH